MVEIDSLYSPVLLFQTFQEFALDQRENPSKYLLAEF